MIEVDNIDFGLVVYEALLFTKSWDIINYT